MNNTVNIEKLTDMFLLLLSALCLPLLESVDSQIHGYGGSRFGLPSLLVPSRCQADVLYEQLNYICVNNEIQCLLGWKVGAMRATATL